MSREVHFEKSTFRLKPGNLSKAYGIRQGAEKRKSTHFIILILILSDKSVKEHKSVTGR